jgi:type IV pilus assembly protein PilY1
MQHGFYSIMDRTIYRYRDAVDSNDPNYKKLVVSTSSPANGLVDLMNSGTSTLKKVEIGSARLEATPRVYENTAPPEVIDWSRQNGWYFEFPVEGEQTLKNPYFYDGSYLLDIISSVPPRSNHTGAVTESGESCSFSSMSDAKQFLTLLDIRTGRPPSVMLFDTNGDGAYTTADGMYNRLTLQPGATLGLHQSVRTHTLRSWSTTGDTVQEDTLMRMPMVSVRASWLHLE